MNDLPAQCFDQRIILAFRVCDDNIVCCCEEHVRHYDKAKIEILLSDQKLEENVHNIGIRNVNMRLKLLYGENSGLSIENIDDNLTESKLKIDRFKMEN